MIPTITGSYKLSIGFVYLTYKMFYNDIAD